MRKTMVVFFGAVVVFFGLNFMLSQAVKAQATSFQTGLTIDCANIFSAQVLASAEVLQRRAACQILFPGDSFTVTIGITNTTDITTSTNFTFTPALGYGEKVNMVSGDIGPGEKKTFDFQFSVPADAGTSLISFSVSLADGSAASKEIDVLNVGIGCNDASCPGSHKIYLPAVMR